MQFTITTKFVLLFFYFPVVSTESTDFRLRHVESASAVSSPPWNLHVFVFSNLLICFEICFRVGIFGPPYGNVLSVLIGSLFLGYQLIDVIPNSLLWKHHFPVFL